MPEAAPRSLGLDAVRAAAIALVLASHGSGMLLSWMGRHLPLRAALSGALGVDLFFVLSGFLIGRILFDTPPTFAAWRVFMARRWLRTLPLYFAWLAVLAVFWPPEFWRPHNGLLWPYLLRFGTLTQGVFRAPADGWFGVSWSLAVEEWFYLLFSAAFLAAHRHLGRRPALAAAGLPLLLFPVAARAAWLAPDGNSHAVLFWADAPIYGVLLAALLGDRRVAPGAALSLLVAGLCLVLPAWAGALRELPGLSPALGRAASPCLLGLGFAAIVAAGTAWRSAPPAVAAPLRTLSGLAYSLYMVHLTVLEIVGFQGGAWSIPPIPRFVLAGLLVALVAYAAHRAVERPFMRLRPTFAGAGGA